MTANDWAIIAVWAMVVATASWRWYRIGYKLGRRDEQVWQEMCRGER